ncbi:MAG: dimethyl sulfoxide reductase anchor subunit [Chloroflexi bacterium]|nr:dimethyl sulfoxide reductase anchor subunit [Chloroflexota bacterium]
MSRMKERSLIAFTILAQLAVGTLWTEGAVHVWAVSNRGVNAASPAIAWPLVATLITLGVIASFLHLGTPGNAWRALSGFRRSWLSREILCAAAFAGCSILVSLLQRFVPAAPAVFDGAALAIGLLGFVLVYCMAQTYRLRTIPAWDTWATPASFLLTTLLLGSMVTAALLLAQEGGAEPMAGGVIHSLAVWGMVLVSAQFLVAVLWVTRMSDVEGPGLNPFQRRANFSALRLRLALSLAGAFALAPLALPGGTQWLPAPGLTMLVACALMIAAEVLGRALFYQSRVRRGV